MALYTTLTADFADSAIDRGHSHRRRLSFGQSPSLPRILVCDDLERRMNAASFLSDQPSIEQRSNQINAASLSVMIAQFIFSLKL